MNADRTLKHSFIISSFAGIVLCIALVMGIPQGSSSVLFYNLLLPFGIACPLISGGCLLHDRLEHGNRPTTAFLIRLAGYGLFWGAAAFVSRRFWG